MSKTSPVVHFEMPYDDRQRMVKFYQQVFGWKIQMLGEEMGNYVVVTTADADVKPDIPRGAIGGGFFKKTNDNQYPSVVIAVEDIRAAMKKVEKAGGKVLGGDPNHPGEPGDIPGVGLYCAFTDTEGNRVSMLQPAM